MYITAKEVKERLGITSQTLYNWRRNDKIKYKKLNSRNFLYDISSLKLSEPKKRKNIIYARVSNTKQKQDLERQINILSEYICSKGLIVDNIYKDIASGMNENRTQFNKMIDSVIDYEIDTIYISYKDRLTRFGYEYLERWFSLYGTKIVHINLTREEDFQTELTEDIISIIHHFSMKMYSNRRKILKMAKDNLSYINK